MKWLELKLSLLKMYKSLLYELVNALGDLNWWLKHLYLVTRSHIVAVKLPDLRILWSESIVPLCTTRLIIAADINFGLLMKICETTLQVSSPMLILVWFWYPEFSLLLQMTKIELSKLPPQSEVKYLRIDLESKWFVPVWLGLCFF